MVSRTLAVDLKEGVGFLPLPLGVSLKPMNKGVGKRINLTFYVWVHEYLRPAVFWESAGEWILLYNFNLAGLQDLGEEGKKLIKRLGCCDLASSLFSSFT